MTKTFTIGTNRKDRDTSIIRATNPADHAELLRAVCCGPHGYVFDLGSSVKIATFKGRETVAHLARAGFSVAA